MDVLHELNFTTVKQIRYLNPLIFILKINMGMMSRELKIKINFNHEIHGNGTKNSKHIRLPTRKKSSTQLNNKTQIWIIPCKVMQSLYVSKIIRTHIDVRANLRFINVNLFYVLRTELGEICQRYELFT